MDKDTFVLDLRVQGLESRERGEELVERIMELVEEYEARVSGFLIVEEEPIDEQDLT